MTPPNLDAARGRQFWRCLEELADSDAFRAHLQREYPDQEADWNDAPTRRRFLTLLGASLALAGLNGCTTRPPEERIFPYIRQPEGLVPGKPLFFATAMPLAGSAVGLLVESHEGRPTKVEGNPEHPASRGATDVFAQAAVLGLYDPERSRSVTHRGQVGGWEDAVQALRAAVEKQRAAKGAGLRLLTESVCSPTLLAQIQAFLQAFPAAKWHVFEPAGGDSAGAGARLAFGRDVNVVYDFAKADVVLSLDADFLACGPGNLRYTRDFTDRRRVRGDDLKMNRLYAVESTPTLTGAKADHRLPLRPSEVEAFAHAVAGRLGVLPLNGPDRFGTWKLTALVADLKRGNSLVIAGNSQPAAVHALAHAMNEALGNVGKTVTYTDSPETDLIDGRRPASSGLRELVDEMRGGAVGTLLILGGNPVFTAPADLDFAGALLDLSLKPNALTVHLSLYDDETSQRCQWHLPAAHFLEAWGDARAYDGTATIMQPLIAALYGGRSAVELVSLLSDSTERTAHDLVKDYWRRFWERKVKSGSFDHVWQRSLHDGIVEGTKLPARSASLRAAWKQDLGRPRQASGTEVVFRPDPTIFDGRFANNGWLQELPRPLTRLTWDNAVLMGPGTAKQMGLNLQPGQDGGGQPGWRGGERGEVICPTVRVKLRGREVVAPAWVMPGHADGVVTLHFGHGRTRAGKVGNGTGFDFYRLRTSDGLWSDSGAAVEPTGGEFTLACTQQHYLMEDRELVRAATLEEYRHNPHFAHKEESRKPLTLYPDFPPASPKHHWAMAIDLTACTGCGACVVACQAENNIPVVGKTEVTHGREMHWLRIDRYYEGPIENPETYFEPVPCMQCENAPCELVCPVHATAHGDDGLNDMVYNRCVGTRYCSNNCPYKVRRFNFFLFQDWDTPQFKMMRNPDVTVRSRGVMEKCTY
ncbi:MAG: TAT-variant-translocated molybdopterin oxidoreductase, partial [Gemmataceae bacterium]